MKFETFTDVGARFSKKVITITANYGFGFSAGIFNDYALKTQSHVILKYARTRDFHMIGFEFTRDKNKQGAIQMTKKGNFAQVGIRSFFSKYKLDPKQMKGAYEVEVDKDLKGDSFIVIRVPIK